jgi:hypothetical protein
MPASDGCLLSLRVPDPISVGPRTQSCYHDSTSLDDKQQLYFETSSGDTYSLHPCSTNLSSCCPPCGRLEGPETLSSLCLRPELGN